MLDFFSTFWVLSLWDWYGLKLAKFNITFVLENEETTFLTMEFVDFLNLKNEFVRGSSHPNRVLI